MLVACAHKREDQAMAFCTRCGKELPEGGAFCADCGKEWALATKERRLSTGKRNARCFLIGLIIILALGGVLYVAEQASLPFELRAEIAGVKAFRRLPPDIQLVISLQRGKTVKELLTMPYSYWSPKVLVGLLSAWGGAWAIHLGYSFFRVVDREEKT